MHACACAHACASAGLQECPRDSGGPRPAGDQGCARAPRTPTSQHSLALCLVNMWESLNKAWHTLPSGASFSLWTTLSACVTVLLSSLPEGLWGCSSSRLA